MNEDIKAYQRGWNDAVNGRKGDETEPAPYWIGRADASVLIDTSYKKGWHDAVGAVRAVLDERFGKEQAS